MLKSVFTLLLFAALFVQPALADTSATNGAEMVKVWKVDFSGRPPFKRELIELPVADVAALEATNKVVDTETVWTVDYAGKPPFRRRMQEIPIIDAASLEIEVDERPSVKRRPLGSFKRHR
jgi:hypothetical protein